jgi:iron-sulfur cluster assembly protein
MMTGITIAESAVNRLRTLLQVRGTPNAGLRISVRGGGCSGLTYSMDWADSPGERDKVFERDGVQVFIEPKSYIYLLNSELKYEESLASSGFKLENPNAKSSCGCGESFST